MRDEVAEQPAERLLARLVEALVAEEHDLVGLQRRADRRDGAGVELRPRGRRRGSRRRCGRRRGGCRGPRLAGGEAGGWRSSEGFPGRTATRRAVSARANRVVPGPNGLQEFVRVVADDLWPTATGLSINGIFFRLPNFRIFPAGSFPDAAGSGERRRVRPSTRLRAASAPWPAALRATLTTVRGDWRGQGSHHGRRLPRGAVSPRRLAARERRPAAAHRDRDPGLGPGAPERPLGRFPPPLRCRLRHARPRRAPRRAGLLRGAARPALRLPLPRPGRLAARGRRDGRSAPSTSPSASATAPPRPSRWSRPTAAGFAPYRRRIAKPVAGSVRVAVGGREVGPDAFACDPPRASSPSRPATSRRRAPP